MNIVCNLKISPKENYETDVRNDNEPIFKFKNYASIKKFRNLENLEIKKSKFLLLIIFVMKKFLNKIRKLQTVKTMQQNDILTDILKENSEVCARYFHKNINFYTKNLIGSSDLKIADLTPAFKKRSKTSKDNDRPKIILPNTFKIYERSIYNQIQTYFNEILCKYQCGFRK